MSSRSLLRSTVSRVLSRTGKSTAPALIDPHPPLCRLSKLATLRSAAMGGGRNCATKQGPLTFVETWNAESSFDEVRLVYGSVQGGSNFGISAAAVAPTAVPGFLPQPLDAAGSPIRFQQVSFRSKGANSAALSPGILGPDAVGSFSFPPIRDLPEGQYGWTPQLSFSDFVPVRSVDRADGGPGCLLVVRTFVDGSHRSSGPYTAKREGDCSDTTSVTERIYRKTFGPGDLVAGSPDAGESRLDMGAIGHGFVYAVQFRSRVPGATVQAVGDSIVQGAGFKAESGISGHISFAHLACASASTPERPVTLLQSGVGGEPSADFYRSALDDLGYSDVTIALIQTWSGNDIKPDFTASQCALVADAAWGRAMHYGELVRRQGGIPVFLSAVPQAPKMWSPGSEAARMSSVVRCAELAERGEFVVDLNGLLGNGAELVRYKREWDAGDDIHPNAAANHAIAEILTPMIRTIIGRAG